MEVDDPVSHAQNVLAQLNVCQRLQQGTDHDASDPDPRLFYPAFAEAIKADIDNPGMDHYDDDAAPGMQA